MPQWVFWLPFAQTQLRRLDRSVAMRLFAAILALKDGTADTKPLAGLAPFKRIRVGMYRVVYRELGDGRYEIVAVGPRGSVYKSLRSRLPGA